MKLSKYRICFVFAILLCLLLCLVSCGKDCKKGHSPGTFTVTREATCEADGLQTASCEVCGETVEESIAKLGHVQGEWKTSRQRSALSGGREAQYCTRCDQLLDARVLAVDYLATQELEKDALPDTLDFEGESIRVLHWADADYPEFEQETRSGSRLDVALYDRNSAIRDRLGVELVWYEKPGNGSNIQLFLSHIENQYMTGTQKYDIIAGYSRTMGLVAIQGMLHDMSTVEQNYLDFDKPWWPREMPESVMYSDSYYTVTGDISTNTHYAMRAVYFNKDMLAERQLENPYEAVYSGAWTLDKMIALTAGIYEDIDRDSQPSREDLYGFVACDYVCAGFFAGGGLRTLENIGDAQHALEFAESFDSPRAVALVRTLGDFIAKKEVLLHDGSKEPSSTRGEVTSIFSKGRALFALEHLSMAKAYTGALSDVGILPIPKADAEQESYCTGMGNRYTLYGIYVDFESRFELGAQGALSMFTAVLECAASEGYRLTTPAILNDMLSGMDEDCGVMYGYIRDGQLYDMGQVCDGYLNTVSETPIKRGAVPHLRWDVVANTVKGELENKLKQIGENFYTYINERA